MGTFTLTIHTGNAAFSDEPDLEIARILQRLADDINNGRINLAHDTPERVRDINGNAVGLVRFIEEED